MKFRKFSSRSRVDGDVSAAVKVHYREVLRVDDIISDR